MRTLTVMEPREAYALWASTYPAHAHNPVMHAEERAMLALLPPTLAGMNVVDAGCGSGRYVLHALRRGAMCVTGVDLSPAMLANARAALDAMPHDATVSLAEGSVTAMPLEDARADVLISGLVVGHVPSLDAAVSEFARVIKPGGVILCSDVHPTGCALGWQRDFKAQGQHLAVRHTVHLVSHWHAACARHGLVIDALEEPMINPDDVPANAHFDPLAMEIPVALVLRLRHPT